MPESVTRLWELVLRASGHLTPGEMILRTALICCSIFAAVQLLSMFVTRYGDRNAMPKSLFLSLLLHCCLGLGWATVVERLPQKYWPRASQEDSPVELTIVQSEEPSSEIGESRTVWNMSSQPVSAQLTRMQRSDLEQMPVDHPQVEQAPSTPAVAPVAELPSGIEQPAANPVQETVASVSTPTPAQTSTDIDPLVREARPEVSATAMRRQTSREASPVDISTRVEPQRPAAQDRASPLVENGAILRLPNEAVTGAIVPKTVAPEDGPIQQRTGPGTAAAEVADTGDSSLSTPATATGDRTSGRFARAGSRTAASSGFESSAPAIARPSTSNPSTANEQRIVASRASLGSDASGPSPRPELARIESGAISTRPRAARDPETYRSRRLEQRRGIALKNGGSEDSERAVEASLRWFASIQESAGNWSPANYGGGAAKQDPQGNYREEGGLHADTGITGLIVLSYLGAGYTHEEGKYTDVVSRALKWLIAQQTANGYLGGRATKYDMMYCHAMATFALAEAYGMQNDANSFPELQDAVRGGVRLICAQQNDDGGWRYGKGGPSDMSMFGWQLMALKSAVNAGIPVPEETRRGMTKFLQSRARGASGGLAGYKATDPPSPAMTAEALFCRQMFGARPRDAASQESVTYLRKNLPRLSAYDEYYWYYGTLAMFQYDGAPWDDWNNSLRDPLISLQRTHGPLAGSWDPTGKWAGIGGRLYSTAVSTLCLEVYYRFLRIYQTRDE